MPWDFIPSQWGLQVRGEKAKLPAIQAGRKCPPRQPHIFRGKRCSWFYESSDEIVNSQWTSIDHVSVIEYIESLTTDVQLDKYR